MRNRKKSSIGHCGCPEDGVKEVRYRGGKRRARGGSVAFGLVIVTFATAIIALPVFSPDDGPMLPPPPAVASAQLIETR